MKGIWWLIILELAALVCWYSASPNGYARLVHLHYEEGLVHAELYRLEQAEARMARAIERVTVSGGLYEAFARRQLGMQYPNELLIAYK
jgi:hypothetical protein